MTLPDVNEPFRCGSYPSKLRCESTRFYDVKQVNVTCCDVPLDVDTSPRRIACVLCGSCFEATPAYEWLYVGHVKQLF